MWDIVCREDVDDFRSYLVDKVLTSDMPLMNQGKPINKVRRCGYRYASSSSGVAVVDNNSGSSKWQGTAPSPLAAACCVLHQQRISTCLLLPVVVDTQG